MKETRWWRRLMYLSVILALGLSLSTIWSESIRLDEAQSIWMASKTLKGFLEITARDVHVPLYGFILHYWIKLGGNDIRWVRLPSLLYFGLTMPVLYQLAKGLASQKVAYMSVILFCLSPFMGWYSGEARMYTLLTLNAAISELYFMKIIKSEGKEGKLGYGLSLISGLYTHYFFGLVVVTQGTYLIIKASQNQGGKVKKWLNPTNLGYVGANLVAIGAFAPWLGYMASLGLAANMKPLLAPPSGFNIIQTFFYFIFGFQDDKVQPILISLWPMVALILFFIYTKRKRAEVNNLEYLALATLLPIGLVFLISFIRPAFLPRYLILVTPSLFIMLAWIIVSNPKRVARGLTTIVLVLLIGLGMYQRISEATPVKEDYQQVAKYLEEKTEIDDIVALSAPFTIYPIEYNYLGKARLETIPRWSRFGTEGPIPDYQEEEMKKQLDDWAKSYKRVYVVLSYDQGYEDKIRHYLDNHYTVLDQKKFPAKIETRVYQLQY